MEPNVADALYHRLFVGRGRQTYTRQKKLAIKRRYQDRTYEPKDYRKDINLYI
jgi:hypothetical protein